MNLLNKLLCFMWGHVFNEKFKIIVDVVDYELTGNYIKCKHCRRVKP